MVYRSCFLWSTLWPTALLHIRIAAFLFLVVIAGRITPAYELLPHFLPMLQRSQVLIRPHVNTPTNLTATPGDSKITLSWSAVSGVVSYRVKRSTVNGGPYSTIANPTTTSYVNTGLTNGTTYYYIVSGVNNGGNESP